MTSEQIATLLAMYPNTGGSTDPGQWVKYVTSSSGRSFRVNNSLGSPGAYSMAVDNTNDFLVFTPTLASGSNPGYIAAPESVPFDSVETIAFFPAGATGTTGFFLAPGGTAPKGIYAPVYGPTGGATGSFNN